MSPRKLKGIVLAGGKSLRFGEDKALAEINGERLIEKSVKLLQSLDLETVVIANAARDYSFLDCRIENDLIPEKGPLGGIYTAFHLFPQATLLILTCDMPNMTKAALQTLIQAEKPSSFVTLFESQRKSLQPFPGIYSFSSYSFLELLLNHSDFSMQTFLNQIPSIAFVSPPIGDSLFVNINTKGDLWN